MATETVTAASTIQLLGAGGFGMIIGWYLYLINRYRKADVQVSDIVTVVGAIGGSAILGLFEAKTDLFGAYGIGLAIGFFAYFLVLLILVGASRFFTFDWFLDGRRTLPDGSVFVPKLGGEPVTGGQGMALSGAGKGNL
jgi:hypothetical protein